MKQASLLKSLLPLLVIVVAIVGAVVMIKAKKAPEQKEVEEKALLVSTMTANSQPVQFTVESQGNVLPKHQTRLSTQVSGTVVEISDRFVVGGMVEKGDVLLTIDQSDYLTDVQLAEAELATAIAALEEEKARGKVAQEEWRSIGQNKAPELGLRKPQLASQEANVKGARARVQRAKRNLERTVIRAPYNAIIVERAVDVGQFLGSGTNIATLYGTDEAEIRLPITDSDLAFLDLDSTSENNVMLSGKVAGQRATWNATLVRSEGILDNTNRVVYAVAQVDDPYRRDTESSSTPLRFGQFVEALISGREQPNLFVLPRYVLRLDGSILTVDEDNKLAIKQIDTVRSTTEHVYVASGLSEGDRIVTSAVPNPYEGMPVRVEGDIPSEAQRDKETQNEQITQAEGE